MSTDSEEGQIERIAHNTALITATLSGKSRANR